jgi:hypothetical protein
MRFVKRILTPLAILGGLLGIIIGILNDDRAVSIASAATLFVLFLLVIIDYLMQWRRKIGLPLPQKVEEVSGQYRALPADLDDVRWIAMTASRVYSGKDVMPAETMLEWYKANPKGMSIIKSATGNRVGNLDILPLKPKFQKALLSGEKIELEIRGSCIYSPGEANKIRDLYIESLVAISDRNKPNAMAAYRVMADCLKLVSRICNPSQVSRVFALGATPEGIKLMQHLGFDCIDDGSKRKDKHPVYCIEFVDLIRNIKGLVVGRPEGEEIRQFLSRVGDEGNL